jgi:inner membrane protein
MAVALAASDMWTNRLAAEREVRPAPGSAHTDSLVPRTPSSCRVSSTRRHAGARLRAWAVASAITHGLVGAAVGWLAASWQARSIRQSSQAEPRHHEWDRVRAVPSAVPGLPWYAAIAAIAPDADVLMHRWVPYAHPFGHRGAFHSACVYACVAAAVAAAPWFRSRRVLAFTCLFLALLSHSLLDMLTDGGHGVALFWPLGEARLFFPWRPIPVSPLSIRAFFSARGVHVLGVELWFAVPACVAARALYAWQARPRG